MKHLLTYIIILFIFVSPVWAQIKITTQFEGGNVEIISISDSANTIVIRPAINKSNTTRVWFYFKVTGYKKNTPLQIKIEYESSVRISNFPVVSTDNKNWNHVSAKTEGYYKLISFSPEADSIYIATGYPYLYTHMINFANRIKQNEYVRIKTLTTSKKKRKVPIYTITDFSVANSSKKLVWIIARQHAFESLTGFVAEGLVNYLISEKNQLTGNLKQTIYKIVPMVDVDNVAEGWSGRMQKPIDFNRDWNEIPYWKTIAKIQDEIETSSQNSEYTMFIDLHTPFPGGTYQLFSYFNIYQNTIENQNLINFWEIFNTIAGYSPYPLDGTNYNPNEVTADIYNNLKYGKSNIKKGKGLDFSFTLECDWHEKPINGFWYKPDLTQLGEYLAQSINQYLTLNHTIPESK